MRRPARHTTRTYRALPPLLRHWSYALHSSSSRSAAARYVALRVGSVCLRCGLAILCGGCQCTVPLLIPREHLVGVAEHHQIVAQRLNLLFVVAVQDVLRAPAGLATGILL